MAFKTYLDADGAEVTEIWGGSAGAEVKYATIDTAGIHGLVDVGNPIASDTSFQAPAVIAGEADAATARTGGIVRASNVVGATTDVAGADLVVAPGLGHGAGTPGVGYLKAPAAAATGNHAQSLVEVAEFTAAAGMLFKKPISGTPDAVTAASGGGAVSVLTPCTEITTDGDSDEDALTLADGVTVGQIKVFVVKAVGNAADSVKITPATMLGGTKITFGASPLGKGCVMQWTSVGWVVVGNNGGTIA
jgi:hypothetical protein